MATGAVMHDGLPETLRWSSHPWAEDTPLRKALLTAIIVLASALAAEAFESFYVGLLSLGVLLLSLSRYFISSTYELTPDGVRVRHGGITRFFPWARFRRAAMRTDGVFLGTFDRPRRLDVWRGCFLRCPKRRDVVYAYARAHVAMGADSSGGEPRAGDAASAQAQPGG